MRDLEQNCVGQLCPESMRGVQQRGEAASTIAPVALGLGIAGIGLAAWGFWGGKRGSASDRGKGSTISAVVAPGGWGVNIAADF